MKRIALFGFLASLLAGCFHKNVMSDVADDVIQSFIYSGTEGTFIITKEEIFQATSKESNGGFTRISGYAEYRITSYELETGEQVGRVEMGEGQEEEFILLGSTPGKIWLYSVDPELGLHCRHPKTMEVISTEADLSASGALQGFSFARPEWSQLGNYYGFHYQSGQLLVSDMQDYHYLYNPDQNTLTQTEEDIEDPTFGSRPLNSSAYFDEENYVSINSSGRNKLTWQYDDKVENLLSFLNAEILMDLNFVRLKEHQKKRLNDLESILNNYQDSIHQLEIQFPEFTKDDFRYPSYNTPAYAAWQKRDTYKRTLEDLIRKKERIANESGFSFGNEPLSPEERCIVLVHGADVSDTARLQISYVACAEQKFTERWKCSPPGLYRNPDKADDMGAFETVFSDGDPSFDYFWADYHANYLVMIWQLQLLCIDLNSGEIKWQKQL